MLCDAFWVCLDSSLRIWWYWIVARRVRAAELEILTQEYPGYLLEQFIKS